MRRPFFKAGLAGAALLALVALIYTLILYWVGVNPFAQYKHFIWGVLALVYISTFWWLRSNNTNKLRGQTAIASGLLISLAGSLLYGLLLSVLLSLQPLGSALVERHRGDLYARMELTKAETVNRYGSVAFEDKFGKQHRQALQKLEATKPATEVSGTEAGEQQYQQQLKELENDRAEKVKLLGEKVFEADWADRHQQMTENLAEMNALSIAADQAMSIFFGGVFLTFIFTLVLKR